MGAYANSTRHLGPGEQAFAACQTALRQLPRDLAARVLEELLVWSDCGSPGADDDLIEYLDSAEGQREIAILSGVEEEVTG